MRSGARKGEAAEQWVTQNTNLTPTKDSGSVHEDGDFRSGGVGGRLYEVKSSVKHKKIHIAGKDVKKILQRARKLSQFPVFLYQNCDEDWYAVVSWDAFKDVLYEQMPSKVSQALLASRAAGIVKKPTEVINITPTDLDGLDIQKFLRFENKTGRWIVMSADVWLFMSGDMDNGGKHVRPS